MNAYSNAFEEGPIITVEARMLRGSVPEKGRHLLVKELIGVGIIRRVAVRFFNKLI